jgi:hypothetical protein
MVRAGELPHHHFVGIHLLGCTSRAGAA